MSIVEIRTGGDVRSLHRHYMRKSKEDLVRSLQDLQRMVGDTPEPTNHLMSFSKGGLAQRALAIHKRLPE
ncbi:hypothetical protein AEAC466_04470 [Asticcacaulis sp. AC466]|uniref:hypothetical protein n=1 Tax=Asticcacaulis sp. AC466 TaxID=1282362 RepID=UPI0003C3F1B5|nr:hypothetical protein [Asticcacaulis sp. AC466]ESQ85424.1 hypothetical protein AEAC466_04470 [Asticcacaulis sp. AC466]